MDLTLLITLVSLFTTLLLIAFYLQYIQVKSLRYQRDELVTLQHKSLKSSKSSSFALLDEFPEAGLVVNSSGHLLFANQSFRQLWQRSTIPHTVQEIDLSWKSNLQRTLEREYTTSRQLIRLHLGQDPERTFLAVSWPLNTADAVQARVVLLFEQTASLQQQREYASLEQQLLRYMRTLGLSLTTATERFERLTPTSSQTRLEQIAQLAEEVQQVSTYLITHHSQLRAHTRIQQVELSGNIHQTLNELRPRFQAERRSVHLVLPSQLQVWINPGDLALLLRTLFEIALSSLATQEAAIFRVENISSAALLTLELPYRTEETSEQVISYHNVQTALLRQITAKVHGEFHYHHSKELGSQYQIKLKAVEKETRAK